ncbi:MAG TPA: carboxymuconolactone decarboxylase family protein [Hyphomicrobiaceae bacterium]|nr:carboxymuconolactone decarboxylase family protein [Hyphomicrobiaceae bacterium]
MARLRYLDDIELAEIPLGEHARTINLYRILGHSPGMAEAFNTVGRYIRWGSKLDPRLRELAILQVGYLARSDYEYSHHVKIGLGFGVTEDDIHGMIAETEGRDSGLEPLARAACAAAREMTQAYRASDAVYAELAQALPPDQLIDLLVTIGFYNAVVRILASTDMDVEDSYKPYLEKFPLPEK